MTNTLRMCGGIILPLLALRGHLFLHWPSPAEELLYTAQEMTKLHTRFCHPSAAKLYAFLERASPEELDASTRGALEALSALCKACQRTSRTPVCFQVSVPTDTARFNSEVIVDLFTVAGRTALSIIDPTQASLFVSLCHRISR